MRTAATLLCLLGMARATSWSFTSAKLDIDGTPYPFTPSSAPVSAVLHPNDKFKILLTTQEGEVSKKPHQAMLLIKDSHSDLEANLVIPVRSDGRGSLALSYKDLGPHLTAHGSVDLTLVLGGFGGVVPLAKHVATLVVKEEDAATTSVIAAPATPLRYGPMPEITHTFRPAQRMPPKIASFGFSVLLLGGLVGLLLAWAHHGGANLRAAKGAVGSAPVAYTVFLAGLVGIEASLFMFWSGWRIMTALAAVLVLSIPTFFSGRFALRETAKRRVDGQR